MSRNLISIEATLFKISESSRDNLCIQIKKALFGYDKTLGCNVSKQMKIDSLKLKLYFISSFFFNFRYCWRLTTEKNLFQTKKLNKQNYQTANIYLRLVSSSARLDEPELGGDAESSLYIFMADRRLKFKNGKM